MPTAYKINRHVPSRDTRCVGCIKIISFVVYKMPPKVVTLEELTDRVNDAQKYGKRRAHAKNSEAACIFGATAFGSGECKGRWDSGTCL